MKNKRQEGKNENLIFNDEVQEVTNVLKLLASQMATANEKLY